MEVDVAALKSLVAEIDAASERYREAKRVTDEAIQELKKLLKEAKREKVQMENAIAGARRQRRGVGGSTW